MTTTRSERDTRGRIRARLLEAASIGVVVVVLGLIEAGGRSLPAEWSVLPATAVGAALVLIALRWARGGRVRWPARLGKRALAYLGGFGARVRGWAIDGGADLRRQPPLERATPGLLLAGAPLPWVAAGLVVLAGAVPHRLLHAAASEVFLVHWLGLLGLWALGLVFALAGVLLAVGTLHDLVFEPRRRAGTLRAEREYGLQAALAIGWTAAAFVLPPMLLLVVGGLGLVLTLGAMSPLWGPDVDLAWSTARDRSVRSCSFLGTLALWAVLWSGAVAFAIAALLGPELPIGSSNALSPLPLTRLLGQVLAGWGAAGSLAMGAMAIATLARPRWAFIGAIRSPRVLRLPERPDPRTESQLLNSFRSTPYTVRFGRDGRAAGDVRVELRTALRLAFAASGGRLDEPDVMTLRRRLDRRAERLHRRALKRGLMTIFERAVVEMPAGADGLWIGPQHWFERAITAPIEGEASGSRCFDSDVGPAFEAHIDWTTRAYWFGLCRRLHLDHLFVERGVGARALGQVLDLLCEVDDVFGGRSRIEERHLRLVPGVTAILHEIPGERTWSRDDYPEPTYAELSRARVLHLFRDRGGERDEVDLASPRRSRPLSPEIR